MSEPLECLYLLVAGDCNLRCSYCYADGGAYGRSTEAMSQATMEAALTRLMPRNGELMLSFFGGEPMLNCRLIRQAIAFAQDRGQRLGTTVRFAMTTNGTVLDDDGLDLLRQHFSHVAVSLDGSRAATNHGRRFLQGDGDVYGRIRHNLERLRRAGISYSLRGTVAEERAGEVASSVRHLAALGATCWRIEPAAGRRWQKEAWRRFSDGMAELGRDSREALLQGSPMLLPGDIYRTAAHRLQGRRQHFPCPAGQRMLAVSTNGDVFPCHQFVAHAEARLGNVHDPLPADFTATDLARSLAGNAVENRPRCRTCTIRHLCGGQCPVHCLSQSGDLARPSADYCALQHRLLTPTLRFVDQLLSSQEGKSRLRHLLGDGT